jgi:hypothetical protein
VLVRGLGGGGSGDRTLVKASRGSYVEEVSRADRGCDKETKEKPLKVVTNQGVFMVLSHSDAGSMPETWVIPSVFHTTYTL